MNINSDPFNYYFISAPLKLKCNIFCGVYIMNIALNKLSKKQKLQIADRTNVQNSDTCINLGVLAVYGPKSGVCSSLSYIWSLLFITVATTVLFVNTNYISFKIYIYTRHSRLSVKLQKDGSTSPMHVNFIYIHIYQA